MTVPTPRESESSDAEDVRAFLGGDAQGFERLVDRHQRSMLRFCQRLVDGAEDARDLFQEVFLQVYRSLDQIRDPGAVRTWMYRIAVRRARRMLRRRPFDRSGPDPRELPGPEDPDLLLAAEQQESMRRHLAELPERQRECVILRHYQNLRFGDIGRILEISEEAARASHYQGLRRLRQRLDPESSP